ncbi:N-6 DNA methylase [Companilactobacillus huachuanensis]|uniref:site-specific DNA-methyltransferase (adenine-specific) n=1 Tax=Companilactobacillus huachuanensis TaxID=2559914 RepID=A0ABW1RNP7_9LACO
MGSRVRNQFRNNPLNSKFSFENLLVSLADIKSCDKILDPTFGFSELIFKILLNNKEQKITAEFIDERFVAMGYIAALGLGATHTKLYTGEVLDEPMYVQDGKLEQFDKVITMPPIGQKLEYTDNVLDDKYNRFPFGIPSRKSGDWAFVSNAIAALNHNLGSKAVVVVRDGALFRGGMDSNIRQKMVDYDLIESIISLPVGAVEDAAISVSIIILTMNKPEKMRGKIQFINIDREMLSTKSLRSIEFTDEEIEQITKWYHDKKDVEGISKIVSNDHIKDTQLQVKRYVYSTLYRVNGRDVQFHSENLKDMKKVPLSEVVDITRGFNLTAKDETTDGMYQIIKITDIKDKINYHDLTYFNLSGNADVNRYLVQKNDIIMAIRGNINKIKWIDETVYNVAINSNLVRLRLKNDKYDPLWLRLYLNSPLVQILLGKSSVGSTITQIPIRDLEKLPVPVLCINAQRKMASDFMEKNDEINKAMNKLELERQEIGKKLYDEMNITGAIELL